MKVILWIVIPSCMIASFPLKADEPTEPHTSIRFIEPNDRSGSSIAVSTTNTALVHTAQILPKPVTIPLDGIDVLSLQMKSCFQELESTLREAGTTLSNVVKLNIYVTADGDGREVESRLSSFLPRGTRPAFSFVTTPLLQPGARIAFDAVAVTNQNPSEVRRWRRRGDSDLNSPTQLLTSGQTAGAILPIGPRLYISGQAEVGDGTLRQATQRTMESLKRTMIHFGIRPADVVQLKAFLRPMSDASTAVAVMEAAFVGSLPPAIVLVEWDSPQAPIEIELIAASPVQPNSKELPSIEFLTPPAMKASPVFARVVRVNHPTTIYLSGLYGTATDPNGGDEVRDLFGTLKRITTENGSDLRHLVKATYYVTTDEVSGHLNTVRPGVYDPERPPAASKAKVRGTGRAGRTITMDLIAVPAMP